MKNILLILSTVACISASAQTMYNLKAAVNATYDGSSMVPDDSSVYTFSGNRYGYDTSPQQYDTLLFKGYASGSYNDVLLTYQTFDNNNNPLVQTTRENQNGLWVNESLIYNTYLSSQKLGTQLQLNWNFSNNDYDSVSFLRYVYSSHAMPDSVIYYLYDPGGWFIQTLQTYTFDTHGNIISETDYYLPGQAGEQRNRIDNQYNIANMPVIRTNFSWNPSTTNWDSTDRHIYVYNSTGLLLLKDSIVSWDATNHQWVNAQRISNTYTGTDRVTSQTENYDGVQFTFLSKDTMAYDANHNLLSNITLYWDQAGMSFQNVSRTRYIYTPGQQLSMKTTDHWDGTGWQYSINDVENRFYYDESVNVPHTGNYLKLQVYPVPASSYLTLDASNNVSENYTVSITDMKGILLRQWNEQGKNIHRQIPINTFPEGNYILHIRTATNSATSIFTVTK